MTFPVFPTLYAYSIHKKPTFKTLLQTPRSGRETTRNQRILPLWEFELRAEILRDETQNQVPAAYFDGYTDLQQVMGLFLACGGQFGWFYFDDTSDNSRSEQGIGTGDGSTTAFRLLRTITYGALTFTEPVGGINLGESIAVFVDGAAVAQSGNWSISTDGLYLVFVSAPANGAVIQISFSYYYLCHFITDDIDFEQFMWNRWSAKSIRFRSLNPSELGAPLDSIPLVPPPRPPPPSNTPPDFVSYGAGRVSVFSTSSNSVALNSDSSFTRLLTTAVPNTLIIVAVISQRTGQPAQTVSGVSSSSGLSFSLIGRNSFDVPPIVNIEFWYARSSLVLTNENITATFNTPTALAVISAVAISGANAGAFQDTGLTPPAFDGESSPNHPAVIITTTNQYDLILWASSSPVGSTNNSVPTGYTTIALPSAILLHGEPTVISSAIGYKRVSALQSAVLLEPAINQGRGVCLVTGIKG